MKATSGGPGKRAVDSGISGPVAILLCFAVSSLSSLAEDRPNILMFAVDDLRPMLGCYGDDRVATPHIDALAESGMLFERAYCNYAKCGPSRLSLMTGLRPGSIQVYGHRDSEVEAFRSANPDAVPMSRWFRESGYSVRSFGKIDHDGWAVEEDWSKPPSPGREGEMLEIAGEDPAEDPSRIAERTACPVMQSPDVEDEYLFAGRMAREVVDLLKKGSPEAPFFYAVGFRRPHLPFVAPKRYFDLYEPDESWLTKQTEPPSGVPFFPWFNSDGYVGMSKKVGEPMPEKKLTREEAIAFNGFEMRSYLGVPYKGEIAKETQIDLLHSYAACVSYVDAQIGKILEQLDASGLRENTIVLLWSDHGWHLGEMSAWGKMTNYEIATRVPLILSAPGLEPGRTDSLAELVDLYPTLCDLTGLEKPGHLEGESLLPILKDPSVPGTSVRHEYVRYNGRYHGKALRTEQYRYVRWRNRKGELELEELYDLDADPNESVNVASQLPGVVERLAKQLKNDE